MAKQRTGSGMDPPVFWAGNTGKSQTTHSIIHEPLPPSWEPRKPALLQPARANRLLPFLLNPNGRSVAVRQPLYFRHRSKG